MWEGPENGSSRKGNMSVVCKDRVKEFVNKSRSVKERKIARVRSESEQMSKDVASYLCRGTRGIKVPLSKTLSVIRVDTTCSECGDRSGEAYFVDGTKLCRTCKIKSEAKK